MKRKDFLKKLTAGTLGLAAGAKVTQAKASTYDRLMKQVGFNHLPNKEMKTMESVLHKASSRGHANHGWLDTHHTFSFANYYNPERMNFGVLRVLNDDVVAGGRGFGRHPHDNMEIISIPLSGDLEHKDSMGNTAIIKEGDVQVMSAGTGVYHSEFNKNKDQDVRFLQIWMFPNQRNVQPRYDQISVDTKKVKNQLYQILSPSSKDEGVWVHQNAWFHLGDLDQDCDINYQIKDPNNGVYTFVLEGNVSINEQNLEKRDGYGVWNAEEIHIKTSGKAKILLMDVPMTLR